MSNQIEEIELNFNLEDAKLLSYYCPETENDVIIKILTQNQQIVEFRFKGVILFIFYDNAISKFCISKSKSEIFDSAIYKCYEAQNDPTPSPIPQKLFQFLNSSGKPCMEIAARSYEYYVQPSEINN